MPVKGEEEYVHIKGESTESELDEEEEDEDSVQLREGDEEEGYKVCACSHIKIPSKPLSTSTTFQFFVDYFFFFFPQQCK